MDRRRGLGLYLLIVAAHCIGLISIVAATMMFEIYGMPRPDYVRNDPQFMHGMLQTGIQYFVLWEVITGFVVISFIAPVIAKGRMSRIIGLFLVIAAIHGVLLFQMSGNGYAILARYIGAGALPAIVALFYALRGTAELKT